MRRLIAIITGLVLAVSVVGPASANWPVRSTSSYISQWFTRSHRGIDVAARYGTPVQAMRSGTVSYVGYRRNCGGLQVYVYQGRGNDGRTRYAAYYHLRSTSTYRGERLSTGEPLGRVGTSGCTTGPHVHIEMWSGYPWRRGSYRINPWWYLRTSFDGVANTYEPRRYR